MALQPVRTAAPDVAGAINQLHSRLTAVEQFTNRLATSAGRDVQTVAGAVQKLQTDLAQVIQALKVLAGRVGDGGGANGVQPAGAPAQGASVVSTASAKVAEVVSPSGAPIEAMNEADANIFLSGGED